MVLREHREALLGAILLLLVGDKASADPMIWSSPSFSSPIILWEPMEKDFCSSVSLGPRSQRYIFSAVPAQSSTTGTERGPSRRDSVIQKN